MAQYRSGTVSVTNGSNVITGDITVFLTNVVSGDLFSVVGSGVTYEVASIVDDTSLLLSVPYGGTTATGASYIIARDFTPNLKLPYVQKGDVETATILKAQAVIIDAFVAAGGVVTQGPQGVQGPPGASVGGIDGGTPGSLFGGTTSFDGGTP